MPLKKTTTKPDATDALVDSDTPGFTGGIDPKMNLTTEATDVVIHTPVIAKIISLCGFSDDSVMVEFIKQKQWKKLLQVTNISVDDVKDFHTVKKDGISMDQKPLMIHVRMLKCFLLYYKRKCREHDKYLCEKDVMNIESNQFYLYCGSTDYFMDLSACVEESSTKQVDMLNTGIVDIVNAAESIQMEDVRGSSPFDEGLEEENVANIDVDVDIHHFDVINDDLYVSERNIGEDVLEKMDSLTYLAQNHLEEVTASDESYCISIRNPNGEYDLYRENTIISNVVVDEIDTTRHLDEGKGAGKLPYKLRERNRSRQEHNKRLIADTFDFHESAGHGSNGDPQVDFGLMLFDMHHIFDETYDDENGGDDDDVDKDVDDNIDKSVTTVEEIEGDDGEDVTNSLQKIIPYHLEWGTCPLCKGCGLIGNSCWECTNEGMKFESTPRWIYDTKDGGIHMIDISRRIICGESLMSLVVSKVLMSTPETALENFLHVMAEGSSEPDVEYYVNSRSELLKVCGLKTVFDIVARGYRLHQANPFDYMNERTGEKMIVAVCNTEYELFCEVGAIWLVHQHRMQPFHPQQDMTPGQQRLFHQNRRDIGAATLDTDMSGDGFNNTYLKKHVWLGDSGASVHVTNDAAGMFDCHNINSYVKINNGKNLYSSMIGNKKVSIVQANGSTTDLILHDCMYIPDIYINLFSITKALSEGWKISNYGLQMVLSRSDQNIKFDQILKTEHGYVCGITMLPLCDLGVSPMELASIYQCHSPFGGEPTSNYLHDNPFKCCDKQFVKSEISFEKSFFHQLDGDPNVKQHMGTLNLMELTAWNNIFNEEKYDTRYHQYISFKFRIKKCEDLKRSTLKVLVTAKYGEPMADYKKFEGYNVVQIEPGGIIKYLHCQNVMFDGQNLNLFMVEDDSLPLWGVLFQYGVKEKAKLHHVVLYFNHKDVSEIWDTKTLGYYWNDGKNSPADVFSKHWRYPQLWHLLNSLLIYSGNTSDLIDEDEKTEVKC